MNNFTKILITISCIFISSGLFATDLHVNSTTGNDSTGDGSISAPYLTITTAISMASTNDALYLVGTFTGEGSDLNGIIVDKNLSIYGEGIDQTILEASSTEFNNAINKRTITINPSITVLLQDLTIRHGYVNTNTNYDGGGGIKSSGILTVLNCKITKNGTHTGSRQNGGGILIAGSGKLTISNSIVSNNQTFGSNGWGGGIMYGNYNNPQALIMTNTTVNDNISTDRGGAMLIMITSGTNEITNCTFFNNTGVSHSCIFNDRSNSIFTNNTIVGNSNGGIYQYANSITLKNNILANNSSYDFYYQSGTVNDNGYNLVEVSTNYTFVGTGDITGDQSSLNISTTLEDNSTQNNSSTLSLQPGSVAINAGNLGTNGAVNVPTNDQRGLSINTIKDIGAYEYDGVLGLEKFEDTGLSVYPNPSENFIQFTKLVKSENYIIYNTLGSEINRGGISKNQKIDIRNFSKGLYIIKFDNQTALKFIKK